MTNPRVIDERWQLERELGEGAYGRVYFARHVHTGQEGAVKLLAPLHSNADKTRFKREVSVWQKVKHPGIVKVLDAGVSKDDLPFIVMEYVDGVPLDEYLRGAGYPVVLQVFIALLVPLGTAHSKGVVHRDLKPDNVYVCNGGAGGIALKILDFGIAKFHEEQALSQTATSQGAGTPAYMSPEQAAARADISSAADIWSVGVMLYDALAGRLPFDGAGRYELVRQGMEGDYPPLSQTAPSLPSALYDLVERMLSADPGGRPRDAWELQAELQRVLAMSDEGGGQHGGLGGQPITPVPTEVGAAPSPAAFLPRHSAAKSAMPDGAPVTPPTTEVGSAPAPAAFIPHNPASGTDPAPQGSARSLGGGTLGVTSAPQTNSMHSRRNVPPLGPPAADSSGMARRGRAGGGSWQLVVGGTIAVALTLATALVVAIGIYVGATKRESSAQGTPLPEDTSSSTAPSDGDLPGGEAPARKRAAAAPSCRVGLTCNGESCCTSLRVPGGTFMLGRGTSEEVPDAYPKGDKDELPAHSATVSSFRLDKYEVTVGRFRAFVNQYTGPFLKPGAGAHPSIAGSGWQVEWDKKLPSSRANFDSKLQCSSEYQTWSSSPAGRENAPINCVSWYDAMAFCIWDGGRLPTEAEWEYAAAGGSEERLHPWGAATPTKMMVNGDIGGLGNSRGPVGSTPSGNGRWGHADLAGSMWEWAFDAWGDYQSAECKNCAKTSILNSNRVLRGGSFNGTAPHLRAAYRNYNTPTNRNIHYGFRCARTPIGK